MRDRRGTRTQRGYDNRWLRYRKQFLIENPLCVYCAQEGRTTAATVVDHIVPANVDRSRFWDSSNHQALCKRCHDSTKAIEEQQGYKPGCGADGWPTDPRHPANRGRGGSKV